MCRSCHGPPDGAGAVELRWAQVIGIEILRKVTAAKRHQAVSGYWQSLATLGRWCRIRSYLDCPPSADTPSLSTL